jgi:hypothetical protein
MPPAVAQRPVEGLPEHDARVLDGVVSARRQVAGHRHLEIEPPVAREEVEHVVEEADAGGSLPGARAVQSEAQGDVRLPRRPLDVGPAPAHARPV